MRVLSLFDLWNKVPCISKQMRTTYVQIVTKKLSKFSLFSRSFTFVDKMCTYFAKEKRGNWKQSC